MATPTVVFDIQEATGAAYDGNRVWFLFWEETTELLMILGVCCTLWIFRRGLFPGVEKWLQEVYGALGLPVRGSGQCKT